MTKHIIQNRKNQNIVLLYDEVPNAKGLAFIQHGLSGFKEQTHIEAMAETFRENGISTVNFDATCSFGESDGDLFDITLTSHSEDLEDVIAWAKTQEWYQEPFYLAGHSLGGGSILNYTYKNPIKSKQLHHFPQSFQDN